MAAITALAQADASLPSMRRIADDIAYVRLPSFFASCQAMQNFSIPRGFGGEHELVVDLRGNGGGNFVGCASHMLSPWMQVTQEKSLTLINTRTRRSCIVRGTAGLDEHKNMGWLPTLNRLVNGRATSDVGPPLQSALNDILASASESPCEHPDDVIVSQHNMKDHSVAAFFAAPESHLRVVLLTDNFCGSDCEMAIDYLALSYPTVIVGNNSMGLSQFTVPVETLLPFTGVSISLAQGLSNHYGDDRSFDGYGFSVDIVLPTSEEQDVDNITKLVKKLKLATKPF